MTRSIAVITLLLVAGTASSFPTPPAKVSCILRNNQETLVHRSKDGTATYEDIDNWIVDCAIEVEDKRVWSGTLSLARPTDFRTAMLAVDEFRSKKAAQILKELKEKR